MEFHVGTSGYSYKEWKGIFYPEDLPASGMLTFYAERLSPVEINNTFYRMPREEVVASWAEQTGENFLFVIKASRRITHFSRLKNTEELVGYIEKNLAQLGTRLGCVLLQLPPNMAKNKERLATFLETWPKSMRAVFEFRHASWFDDEVYELLKQHHVALAVADNEDGEFPAITPTADFGYIRLRRETYTDDQLKERISKIEEQPWDRVYVFFKHEDDGPGLAIHFDELRRGSSDEPPG